MHEGILSGYDDVLALVKRYTWQSGRQPLLLLQQSKHGLL